jgi:hypothetical protein
MAISAERPTRRCSCSAPPCRDAATDLTSTGPVRRRAGSSVIALGVALLVGAAPVAAGRAVSIDVGSIAVREQLVPGGEYRLPTFGVRNPGTESTAYVLTVSYVDGQEGLRPPAEWFTFEPATLTLGVGESRAVETKLRIPADAEPGDYAALIGPQIAPDGSGPRVGAAAAARLTFTIQPSSALDAWLRMIWRFLLENPWVWIVALVVLAAVVLWFLRRRFRFSIQRRT